jgi:hypothetical protein
MGTPEDLLRGYAARVHLLPEDVEYLLGLLARARAEERAAWQARAEALIAAGWEDGRYVAVSRQEEWAQAVAAVRARGKGPQE